jgi:hypothetical protein
MLWDQVYALVQFRRNRYLGSNEAHLRGRWISAGQLFTAIDVNASYKVPDISFFALTFSRSVKSMWRFFPDIRLLVEMGRQKVVINLSTLFFLTSDV